MARAINRQDLLRLARLGALTRLEALERERAQILRAFPGIGPKADGKLVVADAAARQRRRRGRPKISAAGRAAISAAQKKRWAAIKRKASGF